VQQQQMAAAAAYNPYKRVPRPPSAEYLATKLSDNPLGLSNMVPRCVIVRSNASQHGHDAFTMQRGAIRSK
jgi:hypothetical protein